MLDITTDQKPELTTPSKAQLTKRPTQHLSYKERGPELVGTRYSKETHNRIKELCFKFNIEKMHFFNSVVNYALTLPDHQLTTILGITVVNQLTHDDMMTFQTHDDVIMRYQNYTGKRWTRRDDREGKKYNSVDIKLIEIAFILTIERKLRGNTAKQPIKSFSYFTQEIDLILEQKRTGELPSALDEYPRYVLSTWEKRIRPLRDDKWGLKENK